MKLRALYIISITNGDQVYALVEPSAVHAECSAYACNCVMNVERNRFLTSRPCCFFYRHFVARVRVFTAFSSGYGNFTKPVSSQTCLAQKGIAIRTLLVNTHCLAYVTINGVG